MNKNACGILETPDNFFVDHLAPLCSLLEIPIISSKLRCKLLYQNYYPDVDFILKKWSIPYLVENFSNVLYSFVPEPSFRTMLNEEQKKNPENPLWSKPIRFIYHFHGCSDKGYHSQWIDPKGHFKDVDLLLLYGERMQKILEEKKLHQKPKESVCIGNYRYIYYQKHKSFFDQKVEADIFSRFKKDRPILFYAPTWEDAENSCSFFQIPKKTFIELSKQFNVLIKLHPNMTLKTKTHDPKKTLEKIQDYKEISNLLILPFYPLIYPLIERSSLYLGDYSSVGYDVLAFNKPMFFLNSNNRSLKDQGAHLFRCGHSIELKDFPNLSKILLSHLNKKTNAHLSIQKKTYEYAFGKDFSYEELKKRLFRCLLK